MTKDKDVAASRGSLQPKMEFWNELGPALELPVMSRAGIPTVKRVTEEISLKVAAVMP